MKNSKIALGRLSFGIGLIGLLVGLISCGGGGGGGPTTGSTSTSTTSTTSTSTTSGDTSGLPGTKQDLGEAFFFDTTLSNPPGESCGTCHATANHFTDPRPGPTSAGAVKGLFNFRNAPSISYMAFSPPFQIGGGEGGGAIGGQFWDGHATDLPAQAKFPFVNPVEMNNASLSALVATVKAGKFASVLKKLYGNNVFQDDTTAINAIVDAISQFEHESKVSPFTSKYDAFLKGAAQLSPAELRGLAVFDGKGGCSGCHTSSPSPDGTPPLFTNFCYANLGLPKNPKNPFYKIPAQYNPDGANFIDLGLERVTSNPQDAGNFMTPSLRNVAVTPPYFHNGVFTNLTDVVNFYNTRDLGGFPPPEVPDTEDTTELGNLKLTPQEVSDIVAFLQTLTDGYF